MSVQQSDSVGYGWSAASLIGRKFAPTIAFAADDGTSGENGAAEAVESATADQSAVATEAKTETKTDETTTAPEKNNDLEKLQEALRKERELRAQQEKARKQAEKQLQAFQGIDPELAKKAEAILQEQTQREEWQQQVKSDIESEYLPKIEQLAAERDSAIAQLHQYQMDTALERAALKADCFPGEYHLIAPLLKSKTQFDPKSGQVRVVGADGKPVLVKGEPMSVDALIEKLKSEDMGFARHFKAADANGAGISGNGRSPVVDNTVTGSAWERLDKLRQRQGM